ncbi:uncharacterized protein LOC120784598 isoform X2 [Xiphias gladius]|uniref:uncharacterized protein LOC120784598 isoform X2 n=1 Tax=Xiphias gladius TaxID=8245 RepID=UPI001A986869|nr:uncharacterized protein LOC120784598 isoform X2 [Xiphias gladius]
MGASNQSNQEVQGSVQSSLGARPRQYFLLNRVRKRHSWRLQSTMKLFRCCLLLLPFATTVLTAPIRAQREDVLSFLNDELGTMTIPANVTAYRNPTRKPVTEKDSEDAVKGLESHEIEIMIPNVVENDNAPLGRKTGVDKDSVGPVDMSRRLVQDHGSREWTDLDKDEGMTVDAHKEDGNLSGKQDIRLSGDELTGSGSQCANLQRKAGRVNGLNGVLAPGPSREMLDLDSLEDNNDRLAAVGNSRDTDYDETREYISSESYPIAPPEHMPSRFSVPAKSRASW